MANLTLQEFEEALTVLADGGPPEKLRDRLARLNAFHSRRGLGTVRAISERMFALSSGLRRDVPPTRAFQALWMEYVGHRLTRKAGERLDELADKINSHLHEDGSIKDGEDAQLETVLGEYEELLARKVGGVAARLDTLQKAVPSVAAILRARPHCDVPLDPPEPEDEDEHDHEHHHHAHGEHEHDEHHHHEHAHDHPDEHAAPRKAGKSKGARAGAGATSQGEAQGED